MAPNKIIMVIISLLILSSAVMGTSLKLESTSTTPDTIKPGDEVTINTKVKNVFNQNNENQYSYKLVLKPGDQITRKNTIIKEGEEKIGHLGQNEYWNSQFRIKIKEGAPATNYEFDLINKKYLNGDLITETTSKFKLDITGKTFFEASFNEEAQIEQGKQKKVTLKIKNNGGASAGDVKIRLENTEYISIIGSDSYYLNEIKNEEEAEVNLTLYSQHNTPTGAYNIPITVIYNDGTGKVKQSINTGVMVGGDIELNYGSIETSPKEVRPGNDFVKINVQLENSGEDNAEQVTTTLISEKFKSSYSDGNTVSLGKLSSEQSEMIKYYIDIPKDVNPGKHNITLDINYKDQLGESFSEKLEIPFQIIEKPMLEIKEVKATGEAGETIKARISVKNTGEEEAEEVDIRLVPDSSQPFSIEERSVHLGSIDSGKSNTAVFNIKVERKADIKNYSISAFLRAKGDSEVGDDNIYTYNRNVPIRINGKSMNIITIMGIITGILIVSGITALRVSKKFSKKEKTPHTQNNS